MSSKNLLHRNKLEEFKLWLIEHGRTILQTKGSHEVLRWEHKKSNPMPMIFNGSSPDHLTCNSAAIPSVRKFIQQCKT